MLLHMPKHSPKCVQKLALLCDPCGASCTELVHGFFGELTRQQAASNEAVGEHASQQNRAIRNHNQEQPHAVTTAHSVDACTQHSTGLWWRSELLFLMAP